MSTPPEQRLLTADEVRSAVRDGFSDVVADPKTWALAFEAIQKQAQSEAGGWVFGGVKVLFSRLMWVLLIGLAIYMVGGWSALVAFFKLGHA